MPLHQSNCWPRHPTVNRLPHPQLQYANARRHHSKPILQAAMSRYRNPQDETEQLSDFHRETEMLSLENS